MKRVLVVSKHCYCISSYSCIHSISTPANSISWTLVNKLININRDHISIWIPVFFYLCISSRKTFKINMSLLYPSSSMINSSLYPRWSTKILICKKPFLVLCMSWILQHFRCINRHVTLNILPHGLFHIVNNLLPGNQLQAFTKYNKYFFIIHIQSYIKSFSFNLYVLKGCAKRHLIFKSASGRSKRSMLSLTPSFEQYFNSITYLM